MTLVLNVVFPCIQIDASECTFSLNKRLNTTLEVIISFMDNNLVVEMFLVIKFKDSVGIKVTVNSSRTKDRLSSLCNACTSLCEWTRLANVTYLLTKAETQKLNYHFISASPFSRRIEQTEIKSQYGNVCGGGHHAMRERKRQTDKKITGLAFGRLYTTDVLSRNLVPCDKSTTYDLNIRLCFILPMRPISFRNEVPSLRQ